MNEAERRIAIFDLDGTLVSAHLWLGIVRYNFKNKKNRLPIFWYVLSNLALTPFWKMHFIPTGKYYRNWIEGMAKMVRGIKKEKAKEMFDWLADKYLLPTLKEPIFERLKKHQEDGFSTILTSGSFQELLEVIARRLNFDFTIGTDLEVIGDKFSGKTIPPLCFSEGKAEKVKNLLSEINLKINFKESFTYSDSFFDLPILEMVGNPVAVEPDKKLLEIAKNKGWQII